MSAYDELGIRDRLLTPGERAAWLARDRRGGPHDLRRRFPGVVPYLGQIDVQRFAALPTAAALGEPDATIPWASVWQERRR